MVSIETRVLREQADLLRREAARYSQRAASLEAVIAWVKQQEFGEAKDELLRDLKRQLDALLLQKRDLFLLAEALRRICDRYDRTEESIIENGEAYRKLDVRIKSLDLTVVRKLLSRLRVRVTE